MFGALSSKGEKIIKHVANQTENSFLGGIALLENPPWKRNTFQNSLFFGFVKPELQGWRLGKLAPTLVKTYVRGIPIPISIPIATFSGKFCCIVRIFDVLIICAFSWIKGWYQPFALKIYCHAVSVNFSPSPDWDCPTCDLFLEPTVFLSGRPPRGFRYRMPEGANSQNRRTVVCRFDCMHGWTDTHVSNCLVRSPAHASISTISGKQHFKRFLGLLEHHLCNPTEPLSFQGFVAHLFGVAAHSGCDPLFGFSEPNRGLCREGIPSDMHCQKGAMVRSLFICCKLDQKFLSGAILAGAKRENKR